MDFNGVILWRGVRKWSIVRFIFGVAPSDLRGGKKMSADTIVFLVSGKNTR